LGTAARFEAGTAPLPVRTHRQRPGPRTSAASRLLESDATASARARAIIRDALAQWGLARLSDEAEQIISEIISNAVAASSDATPEGDMPGPIVLHVTADNGLLTMRAWDPDPTPPPCDQELPDAYDEHGRGLIIVRAISYQWGWTPAPNGGKYVFATLRTDAQPGGDQK
jgi:anti-sigma regulatory factor (Ser/Thr protein kinase)